MGFSIFACVMAGVMFICYAVTLSEYSKLKHCERKYHYNDIYYPSYDYQYWRYDCYSKYDMKRETAANVAGLGSCLLIFSIVEFFLALTASIYCCASVCCNTPSGAVRNVSWDTQFVDFCMESFFQLSVGSDQAVTLVLVLRCSVDNCTYYFTCISCIFDY